MIATVDRKVRAFILIDEAERSNNITNPDAFTVWLVGLRELTGNSRPRADLFRGCR